MKKIGLMTTLAIVLFTSMALYFPKPTNKNQLVDTEAFKKTVALFPEIDNLHVGLDFEYSTQNLKQLTSPEINFFPDALNSDFSREGPEDYYIYKRLKTNPEIIALITMQKQSFVYGNAGSLLLHVFDTKGKIIDSRYLSSADHTYISTCQNISGQKFIQKQYSITNSESIVEARRKKTTIPKPIYKEESQLQITLTKEGKIIDTQN